jgi:hypothetical protein
VPGRGRSSGAYYCLLSFDDFVGFLSHQSSNHYSAASSRLHDVTESMTLEWVDPVRTASPLASTDVRPLPADASELAASDHRRFAHIGEP